MVARLKLVDPIGPGSPAWAASEKAINAWRDYASSKEPSTGPLAKRYANYRQRMIFLLRENNVGENDIKGWCDFVDQEKNENGL